MRTEFCAGDSVTSGFEEHLASACRHVCVWMRMPMNETVARIDTLHLQRPAQTHWRTNHIDKLSIIQNKLLLFGEKILCAEFYQNAFALHFGRTVPTLASTFAIRQWCNIRHDHGQLVGYVWFAGIQRSCGLSHIDNGYRDEDRITFYFCVRCRSRHMNSADLHFHNGFGREYTC